MRFKYCDKKLTAVVALAAQIAVARDSSVMAPASSAAIAAEALVTVVANSHRKA